MRIVAHTCSNTEIVCALGAGGQLVGVDADSDHPPEIVNRLPQLGRDLHLDIAAVARLKPDLVLTSRTLPGHAVLVDALHAAGLRTLVCQPQSLDDVFSDIRRIAEALGLAVRGAELAHEMRAAMPPVHTAQRPKVLVEWWPKPVIVPARRSWVTDIIRLAGGENPWALHDAESTPLTAEHAQAAAPDAIVMSWCGVPERNYRAELVRRRPGWQAIPAVQHGRIHAITEAYLGRPGPRLVEGYRALRRVVEGCI